MATHERLAQARKDAFARLADLQALYAGERAIRQATQACRLTGTGKGKENAI